MYKNRKLAAERMGLTAGSDEIENFHARNYIGTALKSD